MRSYQNYVFDLYGTLIDIHTNEQKPYLWKKMSHIYTVYGADYSWQKMKETYFHLVYEEEQKLSEETGIPFPEIRLESVFRKMFLKKAPSGLPEGIDEKTWLHLMLNTFRCLSREKFAVYPGTFLKLEELKKQGCRVFLLSNAQGIFTRPEIQVSGLSQYFEAIYLSSDYGMRKPQPELLRKLMREYRLNPEETVMLGNDIASDIKIADECGIDSILLNTWHDTEEAIRKRFDDTEIKALDRVYVLLSGQIYDLCI